MDVTAQFMEGLNSASLKHFHWKVKMSNTLPQLSTCNLGAISLKIASCYKGIMSETASPAYVCKCRLSGYIPEKEWSPCRANGRRAGAPPFP